jgi:Zn-dependent peptidase ImmA (M78 family)
MNESNPSTLARLRAVAPRRGLTNHEARVIAERQAETLLRLAGLTDAPTPLSALEELPRIELTLIPDLQAAGLSFWNGTSWQLVARAEDHPHRQRFSLFHEFKHVIDHPSRDLLYPSETQRERAAEHFAACVLMPKRATVRAWCAGVQDLYDLARRFAVSPDAARLRVHELGLGEPVVRSTYRCSRNLRPRPSFAMAGGETSLGGIT